MVRPIDAQLTIMQTSAVEKVQQTQQRHPDMQQRYFETKLKEERDLEKERVRESEKIEWARIREEERRRGSNQNLEKNSQGENKTPADLEMEADSDEQGLHVDIRI
ncbi:MAG: hypothetical protein U1C55_12360 [Smithellaceae bacterium]|nr:hypothetical protein [Smithellaceae bacterium]